MKTTPSIVSFSSSRKIPRSSLPVSRSKSTRTTFQPAPSFITTAPPLHVLPTNTSPTVLIEPFDFDDESPTINITLSPTQFSHKSPRHLSISKPSYPLNVTQIETYPEHTDDSLSIDEFSPSSDPLEATSPSRFNRHFPSVIVTPRPDYHEPFSDSPASSPSVAYEPVRHPVVEEEDDLDDPAFGSFPFLSVYSPAAIDSSSFLPCQRQLQSLYNLL
ncbi:hypothetical protein GEMRC1_012558 [Eukaryota sp. GEM-RC1]